MASLIDQVQAETASRRDAWSTADDLLSAGCCMRLQRKPLWINSSGGRG